MDNLQFFTFMFLHVCIFQIIYEWNCLHLNELTSEYSITFVSEFVCMSNYWFQVFIYHVFMFSTYHLSKLNLFHLHLFIIFMVWSHLSIYHICLKGSCVQIELNLNTIIVYSHCYPLLRIYVCLFVFNNLNFVQINVNLIFLTAYPSPRDSFMHCGFG